MTNTQKASFTFVSHHINKFSYEAPSPDQEINIDIDFNPSGTFKSTEGIFVLNLQFDATYGDGNGKKKFASALVEGEFKFSENVEFENIPEYFYPNSIAIIFPYVRAFVTTLTSVANIRPLILPTLNLGALAIPLKENTKVI